MIRNNFFHLSKFCVRQKCRYQFIVRIYNVRKMSNEIFTEAQRIFIDFCSEEPIFNEY